MESILSTNAIDPATKPSLPISQPSIELSIIITTYNRLPLLKEAIDSFHGQLTCTYEVIIVDDGSSDGTADYLSALGEPFRIFLCAHQGVQAARNTGMNAAIGEFLKFFDDDDLLVASAVDAQVRYLKQAPTVDVCYSDWGLSSYQHDRVEQRWLYVMNQIPDPVEYFILDWWCAPFVYLFRHSAVVGLHWDDISVLTDFIFLSDVVLAGAHFGYLPTAPVTLGWYRFIAKKSQRLSQQASNLVRAQSELKILKKMEDQLAKNGTLTERRKQALAARYYRIARRIFPADRRLFRQLTEAVKALDPHFEPEGKRYRRLVRWLGPENAEWLRRFSLSVRAALRRVKSRIRPQRALDSVAASASDVIIIRVDKRTIVPKINSA